MSSTSPASVPTEKIATGRLWWVSLLAVIASVAANAVVGTIAVVLFDVPPEFEPLNWPQFTFLTVAGVVGAVVVFAVVGRFS